MSTAAAAVNKPSLTIKRRFNTSPAKVFAAWTQAEKLAQWMRPPNATKVETECDPRVGGRFHIRMVLPDDEHNVSGVYREVVPDEKLVFTWAWKTMPERESLMTLTFKEDDGGTLMTLLHEQFFDEAARDRHQQGWTAMMDNLEKYFG